MKTPPSFAHAAATDAAGQPVNRPSYGLNALATILCIAALLMVQGCRPDEQDRVKFYEPGVYKGAEDEPLEDETLNDLGRRAMEQQSP